VKAGRRKSRCAKKKMAQTGKRDVRKTNTVREERRQMTRGALPKLTKRGTDFCGKKNPGKRNKKKNQEADKLGVEKPAQQPRKGTRILNSTREGVRFNAGGRTRMRRRSAT